jgi:hypothetical protein
MLKPSPLEAKIFLQKKKTFNKNPKAHFTFVG